MCAWVLGNGGMDATKPARESMEAVRRGMKRQAEAVPVMFESGLLRVP